MIQIGTKVIFQFMTIKLSGKMVKDMKRVGL